MTRVLRWTLAMMIALVALATPRTATAQGTSGSFPSPISSHDLEEYAAWLALSPDQLLAFVAFHDDYRRDFRLLREGEIAVFLGDATAMGGGVPQRDRVEAILDRMGAINDKIVALENILFGRLEPVLSDEQRLILPRVRLERARSRFGVILTAASFGRATVDVSRLVRDLELDENVLPLIDSTLTSYERRLTRAMGERAEAQLTFTLRLVEALEARGFIELTQEEILQDPELLRKVLAAVQEIYVELNTESAELSREISDLSRRTFRSVSSQLDPVDAQRLLLAYHRVAHQELAGVVAIADNSWLRRAAELTELTEDERALVSDASRRLDEKFVRLLTTGEDVVEEFWASFSPYDLDQDQRTNFRDKLVELNEQAREARDASDAEIMQALGDDRSKALRELARAAAESASAPQVAAVSAQSSSGFEYSGDRFLPARIRGHDIRSMAQAIGLAADERGVLETLHQDYQTAYRQIETIDELQDFRRTMRDEEARAKSGKSVEELFNHIRELRRRALEQIVAIDTEFFENAAALLGEAHAPVVKELQRLRERTHYRGSASSQGFLGADDVAEGGVDLAWLAIEELGAEALVDGDLDFAQYHAEALPAIREKFSASVEMQSLAERWSIEVEERARVDIASVVELQNEYRSLMASAMNRMESVDTQLVAINRRALDSLGSSLDDASAARVRRAYSRAAYPSIYVDASGVTDQLTAALALGDLTSDQRDQLSELAGSYQAEYARLTQEMVGATGYGSISVVGLDPEAFQEWQIAQRRMARLRFDRNELNAHAIRQLQVVLTEAQVAEIGGLPAPVEEDASFFLR